MIKRNPSKTTDSLVDTAQSEHFNIAEGIRTDVPITNLKSVNKSINFLSEDDGSYTLRPPLVLKETLSKNSWYLYDKQYILSINNSRISITNADNPSETVNIVLKYFDCTIKLNELHFTDNDDYLVSYISKIISVNTFKEYTLLSTKINLIGFANYILAFNTRHSTTYGTRLVYEDARYQYVDSGNGYRFIKIYQDTEATSLTWVIEIVYPELNSITSSSDTRANLDVNLLLDNPYAIRDLYGYGYISTTKILPYVPIRYTKAQTNSHTVCSLTEGVVVPILGVQEGFKLLASASPKSLNFNAMLLKAFLTTSKTDAVYYGVWEESTNEGIDWHVCPEFIEKFENNANNPLVKKLVSDITSEEFEKLAYQESLEQATSYLVEKQMVRLNYKFDGNNPADLSETDHLIDRPDVLYIQAPNLSKRYRFQVYVDTLKDYPTAEFIDKPYVKYTFTSLSGDIEPNLVTYDASHAYAYRGQTYNSSTASYENTDASLNQNCIVLHAAEDGDVLVSANTNDNPTKFGNVLKICCTKQSSKSYIKKVIVTTTKNDCYLDATLGADNAAVLYSSTPRRVPKDTSVTFEFTADPSKSSIYIINRGYKTTDNSLDACIASVKVIYALEGSVQSTSIYLASSTGSYKVPYSEETVFADTLKQERDTLFNGKTSEYEHQMLTFNKYSLFSSDVDSTIFRFLKTINFATEIVNVIPWRSYLLVFTEKDVSLLKYDYSTDSYNIKCLSNSIGLPKKDANTVVCILNSVYFKAGYKIYRLIPNLYASTDDILNLHTVSDSIDNLIEELLAPELETSNFVYANAYRYYLFIPIVNKNITYCFVYDYTRKIWNLFEYPIIVKSIESLGISEEYLKTDNGLYYFKDKISTLLNQKLIYDYTEIGYSENAETYTICSDDEDIVASSDTYIKLDSLIPRIPHVDFLDCTLEQLYSFLESSSVYVNDENYTIEDTTSDSSIQMYPIKYFIDFGQKSSNYTVYKTYLETKLTLATLSEKDTFPFDLYITTDGINTPLHWDINTDSALWKNSFSHKGTLSTLFTTETSEYNGIIRQLIVKYSGKGKTIHHIITGKSKYNFKVYSMDVRSRLLPKK